MLDSLIFHCSQLLVHRANIGDKQVGPLEVFLCLHGDGLLRIFERKAFGDSRGDFLSQFLEIKSLFLKGILPGQAAVAGDDFWCECCPDI